MDNLYSLSTVADKDLDDIFEFSEQKFGFDQAFKYLEEIHNLCNVLGENPMIGKFRPEVKNGLYSFPKNKHIIF
jgi:toxin ParE1/3/4